MRIRTLGFIAALMMAAVPFSTAQANDWWGRERSPMHDLRQACDWGDRRACIRFGREIEQRREARREWREEQRRAWAHDQWRYGRRDGWGRNW